MKLKYLTSLTRGYQPPGFGQPWPSCWLGRAPHRAHLFIISAPALCSHLTTWAPAALFLRTVLANISLVISKLPPAPQTCLSESQTALCALFTVYVGAALQVRPNSQLGQSGDIVRDNKHWSAASGDMRQSATRCHMSGHGDNTGLYTWIY